jgi:ABC-type multidrug transport system ATPase subunit
MPVVELSGIRKTYDQGRVEAVRDASFAVEPGELFGLIGPDGAGKTSIFRILTTLLLADSGVATVAGFDTRRNPFEIRRRVGYMPGKFSLYQDLTVEENLSFFATVFDTTIQANYEQVKDIYEQIKPFSNRPAGKLSGGMKQKLALCCALIHRPEVLFLDEPTTGVDVVSRKEFWDMLGKLKQQGMTILVSTPYMDEASLCDRVSLIQRGRIMAVDVPGAIAASFPHVMFAVKAGNMYQLLKALRAAPAIESCYAFGEFLHVTLNDDHDSDGVFSRIAAADKLQDLEVRRIAPSIEDSFIRLMLATQDAAETHGPLEQ